MIRLAILLLAALLLAPASASAEWLTSSPESGGVAVTSVSKGQCVIERYTATGQGALLQAPIWPTMVKLIPNIAGTDVGDVKVQVRECPPGTTAYSANVCTVRTFKDSAGTVVGKLDGTTTTLTDALYEARSPVFVIDVTDHVGGGRVAEVMLCPDSD